MDRRSLLRHAARGLIAGPVALPGARPRSRAPDGWTVWLDDPALGGRGDGATVNDGAFLQALEDMPPGGGTVVLRAGGTWLFDSVDLALVGRRGVTVRAGGAVVRKAPTTVGHMFHDARGTSDGFTVAGGTWEAGREHFEPGQVCSPFHFDRCDDLAFHDATFRDGIEEGLKLYKPVGVRVDRCRFERFRNNGVQIHSPEATGYAGPKGDRGASDVLVTRSVFVEVDDGLAGWEGQGLSVGSTDPRHPASDVVVTECVFDGCVRGLWSENNVEDARARRVWFDRNVVRASQFHGIGLIGVAGGGARGNRLVDIGTRVPDPPRTASSEVAGLVLSGSEGVPGEDLEVADNEIVDTRGAAALMQYGILVRRQRRLTLRDNVVRGATVRALEAHDVADSLLEPPTPG